MQAPDPEGARWLTVTNTGGPVWAFSGHAYGFFMVEPWDEELGLTDGREPEFIPILDYFGDQGLFPYNGVPTNRVEGEMITWVAAFHNSYYQITMDCMILAEESDQSLYVSTVELIEISYVDHLQRSRTEYFRVGPMGTYGRADVTPLAAAEAVALIDLFKEREQSGYAVLREEVTGESPWSVWQQIQALA